MAISIYSRCPLEAMSFHILRRLLRAPISNLSPDDSVVVFAISRTQSDPLSANNELSSAAMAYDPSAVVMSGVAQPNVRIFYVEIQVLGHNVAR